MYMYAIPVHTVEGSSPTEYRVTLKIIVPQQPRSTVESGESSVSVCCVVPDDVSVRPRAVVKSTCVPEIFFFRAAQPVCMREKPI